MDTQDQKPQLGIVLLQTPAGTTFDDEVHGVVAAIVGAGLRPELAGTVFRIEHGGSTAILTPEPAPLTYNEAFTPWIASSPGPDGLRERYRTHTGLMSVRTEVGGDPGTTRRLLLELVRLVASHRSATVVTIVEDAAFWYAEHVREWPAYLDLPAGPT